MGFIDWLNSFLSLIAPVAPAAQFIAYTCLTVTSVIVATVSLRFSYRQNFGWPPLLLVSTHGMQSEFGEGKDESINFASLHFEVWNRHTYPIIIESAQVTFTQDILDRSVPRLDRETAWWVEPQSVCVYLQREVLKNGEHQSFELVEPMKEGMHFNTVDGPIEIEVTYFDPRREKQKKLTTKYRFHLR